MFVYKTYGRSLRVAMVVSVGIVSATATTSALATVYSGVEKGYGDLWGRITHDSAATHLVVNSPNLFSPGYGTNLEGDSTTGSLKLTVSAAAGYMETGWVGFSEAYGTFSGYQPADLGYLIYSIHGSFTDNEPAYDYNQAYGFFHVGVSDGVTQTTRRYDFVSNAINCSSGDDVCIVGESPGTQIGVIPFSLTANSYTFSSSLKMSVQGYTANFSNTAKFYLSLPAGVSFTSDSGTFLSQATPIALVPEPESYAMLLAGLAIVGAVVGRREKDRI